MEANDVGYGKVHYRPDDNEENNLNEYRTLARLYRKLSKGRISVIKLKSSLNDFDKETKRYISLSVQS